MNIQPSLFKKASLIFIPALLCLTMANAQSKPGSQDKEAAKEARIKNWVDSQTYVFKARSAMPMSGTTRQLTSDYDVKVTKTSVVSYLPYFGKAYSAPMNMTGGGIQFNSKDFSYTTTPKKKGGWDIQIKPKDVQDVQQMTLSISQSGYASLQVTSTSRQPISFNGVIAGLKAH
jgi:hypothetical protein